MNYSQVIEQPTITHSSYTIPSNSLATFPLMKRNTWLSDRGG